jgi:hypothetical protein
MDVRVSARRLVARNARKLVIYDQHLIEQPAIHVCKRSNMIGADNIHTPTAGAKAGRRVEW